MKKGVLAFLSYCAVTVALTYPLIVHMGSVLPNDPGDPALNTWILWWNTQAMPLSGAWWNAPAFFPAPGVMSFSENLLGLSLISTPLHWLGADPQTAYNIVFLLTFPLSALGAYLLGYELTRRHDAAWIAGLLFGFAPYRIAHMPQVQALASFPMPFALLGLHRYLRLSTNAASVSSDVEGHEAQTKWLALFAAGWFLQGLCNGYYLLFFSVFLVLWILWFANPWSRPRQFVAISIAWGVAAIPILPLLLRYRAIHASFGFTRDFETIRQFGADVAAILYATPHLAWWSWLHVFRRAEGELFPGVTISVLVIAGALFVRDRNDVRVQRWVVARRTLVALTIATMLVALSAVVIGPWQLAPFGVLLLSVSNPVKPLTLSLVLGLAVLLTSPVLRRAYIRQSVLGFYAFAGFMMWLLSLGPGPTLMGDPLLYRGPYALLMYLPGFSTLRVPARFWMMTTLSLAVIGAIVFDRLAARFGKARTAIAAVIAICVLADTWMTKMPLAATPKPFAALSCDERGMGPIMELPLGDPYADVAAMYRQISHGRPVLNGYSGYFPPHYTALKSGLSLLEPDVLTQLAAHGVTHVIVDRDQDTRGRWDHYVQSHPLATRICTVGKQSLYRMTAPPVSAAPLQGEPVPVTLLRANVNPELAASMVDGDLRTRWQSGPQGEGIRVDIELASVQMVQGLDVSLGPFVEDFPRSLAIEVSQDGQSWQQVWKGGSAGLAVVAGFDPTGKTPMQYRFPAAEARIVRMRLLSNDDIYYWSIAELKVVGR